jgi:protein-S-isoprenylcysteine O-methyltransferase Ste14
MRKIKGINLFILALIFSFALMFAFVKLPGLIDSLLQKNVGFPGFDQGSDKFNAYKSELFIDSLYLRWIGYASLLITFGLIVLGFVLKKSGWAFAGAFALFLPTFGQFALSMFFLAGLGILRVGWLPFMDVSFNVLQLGNVIYFPYSFLMWAAGLINWNAHQFISYFFMGAGTLFFVWGVLVWFQTRFGKAGVATNSIYKFSRHPQYTGWLIWSYGLMLFSFNINNMKKSWTVSSSLPWLLSAMVIIGLCCIEEIKMKKEKGEEYENYKKKTPFLFPIPKWLKEIVISPIKLLIRKDTPSTKTEVAVITIFYTITLILFSLFWVNFGTTEQNQIAVTSTNPKHQIDSLIKEIRISERRNMNEHFNVFKSMGTVAIGPLINLLSDTDPVIREFSAETLGDMKADTATNHLIPLLKDEKARVRNSAAFALGKLRSEKVIPFFVEQLNNLAGPGMRYFIYNALGEIGSEKARNLLIKGTKDSTWFVKNGAINALCKIDSERSADIIRNSLYDRDTNVRRNSVYLILKYKIKSLKEDVRALIDDEDFETRFYSKIILDRL